MFIVLVRICLNMWIVCVFAERLLCSCVTGVYSQDLLPSPIHCQVNNWHSNFSFIPFYVINTPCPSLKNGCCNQFYLVKGLWVFFIVLKMVCLCMRAQKTWLNRLDLYIGNCFCCNGFLSTNCMYGREVILLSPETRKMHTRQTLSLSHLNVQTVRCLNIYIARNGHFWDLQPLLYWWLNSLKTFMLFACVGQSWLLPNGPIIVFRNRSFTAGIGE